MSKMSEAEIKKMLGKRTPLPGGDKQLSPQMMAKPKSDTPKTEATKQPIADFSGLTNPKRVIEKRMEAAEKGMKCGGKVKKMAGGGSVRGAGCATKGIGKARMC
jgi:hypothetical protein